MAQEFFWHRTLPIFTLIRSWVLLGLLFVIPHGGLAEETDPKQGVDVYGQINRGILFYDDGADSDVYPFVDNSKLASRLGLTYYTPLRNGWQFQAHGEVGLVWGETNAIN
ncbi:hypothetical protein [Falsiruegeria mediterranea]